MLIYSSNTLRSHGHSITDVQNTCIDTAYTEDALYALITASYERVYRNSRIVAEINDFVESSGGQKILAAIEEKSKQIGGKAAAEQLRSELVLSATEEKHFELFARSTVGKVYLEATRILPIVQKLLLSQFALAAKKMRGSAIASLDE